MWDYAVVTDVHPSKYQEMCARYQSEGFTLHESNHYRIPPATHRSLGTPHSEGRWDLVFRRLSKDVSVGQQLINNAYAKLREVREALAPMRDAGDPQMPLGRVVAYIDEFLFKGSPEDM